MKSEFKHTLVLGASLNPARYSHSCIVDLVRSGHPVTAVGLREGIVEGVPVQKGLPDVQGIHTVTLYLNPLNQRSYYTYILSLAPKRIIFNPGTWNPELVALAEEKGIETESRCTLMMLAADSF
ncbi:MAG TPA: CoA-binding protein [Lentimicrobium sp.]|jgi:hypothetical protein|nr:CoA-binding protein [Lentimicrobium sp.]